MALRILVLTGTTAVVIIAGAYAVSRMDFIARSRVQAGGDTLVCELRRCDSQILATVREDRGWFANGAVDTIAWLQGDHRGEAAAIQADQEKGHVRFSMGEDELVYSLHDRRFLLWPAIEIPGN